MEKETVHVKVSRKAMAYFPVLRCREKGEIWRI
nr:MAG TPA: hypothetical protein [Caudoviricetes sp.]